MFSSLSVISYFRYKNLAFRNISCAITALYGCLCGPVAVELAGRMSVSGRVAYLLEAGVMSVWGSM
jgi:hypothetical protein